MDFGSELYIPTPGAQNFSISKLIQKISQAIPSWFRISDPRLELSKPYPKPCITSPSPILSLLPPSPPVLPSFPLLQQPTHTLTIRHWTHPMPPKPIPCMMPMKPMRTTHTKHHQPTFQILRLQRLRRPHLSRIRTPEPHHAQPASRHLRVAVRACEGGGGGGVLSASGGKRGLGHGPGVRGMRMRGMRMARRGTRRPGVGVRDGDEVLPASLRIFPQREILLAIMAANRQTRSAGFIHTSPFATHTPQIMLLDIPRPLQERAPHLHLVQVAIFPERPARILDIQRACAG